MLVKEFGRYYIEMFFLESYLHYEAFQTHSYTNKLPPHTKKLDNK